MNERPAPLVPPEVDLRDYDYIPLYGTRLFDSDTWGLCDADEKVAALQLWWASWHEEPAGSLPNNDRLLAGRAGYGVALKAFLAVKENAMRGWIECSDGRLYHPVVASIALEVWRTKRKKNNDNAADRERKRLKRLAAKLAENGNCPPDKQQIPPDIQPENALKGKGKGSEEEYSVGSNEPTAGNVIELAPAPVDPEKAYFEYARIVFGAKGNSLGAKIFHHYGKDVARSIRVLDLCRKKADPAAYANAMMRGDRETATDDVIAETDALYRQWNVQ